MAEYLNISVEGKHSGLKLIVYPQSSKAMVFEEREPLPGESRWQLVEGCTYAGFSGTGTLIQRKGHS